MVRLCKETAHHPYSEHTSTRVSLPRGTRPALEDQTKQLVSDASTIEEKIEWIVGFTSNLGETVADESLNDRRFGGTEEAIVDRGSD